MIAKFEKEFREAMPNTIGETDAHFDLDNYKDWLEEELTATREKLESLSKQPERFKGKFIADTPEAREHAEKVFSWMKGEKPHEMLTRQPKSKLTEPQSKLSPDLAYNSEDNVNQNAEAEKLEKEIIYCGKCQDILSESEKISMWWDWALSAWKKGKLRKKYFPKTTKLKPEQIEYIYKSEEALNSLKQ